MESGNATPRRSADARRSRRDKLPWPKDRDFHILSIDGGGIRGILPTAILAGLEHLLPTNTRIVDYFDLIAGTSTGGIISLALALGRPTQEILNLYLARGCEIFPPNSFRGLKWLFKAARKPLFDRAGLDRVLEEEFLDAYFWQAKTRLCIPAVEGRFGESYIYKTPHHKDYRKDWRNSITEVARATSAAPVYLEAIEHGGYTLVDGGLFANDPIMVALVDVLACFDVPPARVKILSLGCLTSRWNIDQVQKLGKGWFSWGRHAYEITGALQSQNAQGQAGLIVGPENILRIDAEQLVPRIELDDWKRSVAILPSLSEQLLKQNADTILQTFFSRTVERYEPHYYPD